MVSVMQDFYLRVTATRKHITNLLRWITWTKQMRITSKRKVSAAAFVIGSVTIIWILFSTRDTNTAEPGEQKLRQYNYDVLQVVRRFGSLARQKNIVICVIEPHILFSILSQEQQRRLSLRSSFSFSPRNKNVVTVAVQGKSAWRLSQNAIITDFESSGFAYVSMTKAPEILSGRNMSTHHFYIRHGVVIHAVIFYQRAHYFWHGKLENVPIEVAEELTTDLFFAKSDSVYDSFRAVPMGRNGIYQGLYVPENTEHFLLQIPTSQHVKCLSGASRRITDYQNISSDFAVPPEVFVKTADTVVKEMKSVMRSHLAPVWLASGTLLGWYRNCGIIPYTSDMDFATWSSDLNTVLEKDFKENSQLKLISTLGKNEEDFEFWLIYKWLRVDLFFTYRNDSEFWVGGHNPGTGYSFRYIFPKFDLCSGDFLGHKVLVPCQVEKVLEAEYGHGWMTPAVQWNYETSAHNVMGRRYWSKDEAFNFIKQISSYQ